MQACRAALPALLAAALLALPAAFDHQAHAVPGPSRTAYENPPGSGRARVTLDGTSSHSHYFDEGPPVVSGRIVSYAWRDAETGVLLGARPVLDAKFAVGETTVRLTVKDQTGDEASATTTVTVVAADRFVPGAMLYFYDVHTTAQFASSSPRPFFSQWRKNVAVWDHMDLPVDVRPTSTKAIRVVTQFMPGGTGAYSFAIKYMGGGLRCFVNEQLVGKGDASEEAKEKELRFSHNAEAGKRLHIEILLNRRFFQTRIVLYDNAKATETEPATTQGVTTSATLVFEPRRVVPIVLYASRKSSSLGGGQEIHVRASGLDGAGDFAVWFACVDKKITRRLEISRIDAATHTIHGLVPEFPEACEANLYIETALKGDSNGIPFRFTQGQGPPGSDRFENGPLPPVKFRKAVIRDKNGKPFKIPAVTTIAFGPDGRYYLGTLTGVVNILSVDSQSLKVKSLCKSPRVAKKGSILGLAFNPLDKYSTNSAMLYMSVSVLYFKSKKTGYRWDNGQIIAWKSVNDDRCMIFDRDVITGLPVSDRDHGVNAITFDTTGKLYISVGSNTNAGVKAPLFGNIPEGQLSAAILMADISKPGFNGKIKYSQYKDIGKAKKKSGNVSLYATGIRNSFGLAFHSKFGLFATDNGMNQNFGATSTGCNSQKPTKKTQRDKLMRVKKGAYYGFPNRARKECEFVSGKVALLEIEPATTGIAEYTANTFAGRLRGSLFLTKFAVRGTGLTTRVSLSADGDKLAGGPTKVADLSGLAVAVGPRGDLVMPQVQQGIVRALQAVESVGGAPVVVSVWPRAGPRRGGNVVRVYGSGLGGEVKVMFGGKVCGVVGREDGDGVVLCSVPAGERGGVKVTVKRGDVESVSYGDEYVYA